MNRMTHVTTFYSFKGGVGRTMLLANVGAALAKKGRKVLLWDLDVEAPGMHLIPDLTPQPQAEQGFLEWLLEWQEKRRMTLPPNRQSLNDLFKRIRAVPLAEITGLSILPAFGEKVDSIGLYQDIRWHEFLIEDPDKGLTLFRTLLDYFADKGGFDHILMDARTGVTDLGGLMTAILPHATVLVGSYGAQNLDGLLRVYEALQPAVEGRIPDRAKAGIMGLERFVVISPVPADQEEKRKARKTLWDERFPLGKEETRVEIPFDGRLLFTEELLVLKDPDAKAAQGYAKVAARIEELRDDLLRSHEEIAETEIAYTGMEGPKDNGERQKKGQSFEDRVARLLLLLGYRVEREQIVDGNRMDLIARKQSGLRAECYLVECKAQRSPVGKSVLEKQLTWLDGDQARQMRAEGMVVAQDFSPAARTYAKSRNLHLYTPEELERLLFDFGPYLTRIRRSFEESGLMRTYVGQKVHLESSKELSEGVDLAPYAMAWAAGRQGSRLWLLLGDYGTGKTTFVKRFAFELAKAQDDPEMRAQGLPVPIAIDLKEFPNAISLEGLLQDHMRKYSDWHGNPEILLYLLGQGKVVLLFDAFDEMGAATIGRSVEDQFRQLVRPVAQEGSPAGNHILVTCRTHFFRDQQYVKDALHGAADDLVSRDSALGRLARTFDATIDELLLFNNEQIDQFLHKHLSREKAAQAKAFIQKTYDLPQLAPRPVLLEMIVQSLPELMRAGGNVTAAGLYHRYTSHWLEDRAGGSLQTTPQQRKLLLEFLACELWGQPQNRIHYREIIRALEKVPVEHRVGLDLDRVDLELRTAAFLIRTNDGFYSFSHRSFLEFFFARRLLRALREGEQALIGVLNTASLTPEGISFFAELLERETDWQRCRSGMKNILAAPYRPLASENALRLAYYVAQSTVSRREKQERSGFGGVIGLEMAPMMPEHAQLQGANLRGEHLSEAWLRGATFEKADLERCDLSFVDAAGACFRDAGMDRARLNHGKFAASDFMGASLNTAEARNADFTGASFENADLTASIFTDALCNKASFRKANCHAARFARAHLQDTDWDSAILTRVTAPDAIPALSFIPSPPARLEPFFQLGHSGWVRSAIFSPDASLVLTASDDQTARIWDAKTGRELRTFAGHGSGVNSAIFSPDASLVLTASDDETARLWDAKTGRELRTFAGHGSGINSAVFSPDAGLVLTASDDKTARLWDAKTGRELRTFAGHGSGINSAVFSPDAGLVLTASDDKTARLWDAKTGRESRTFAGHGSGINSAIFSPDAGLVLTASEDETARLWDAKTGRELRTFAGHGSGINSAIFSPDASLVLTASIDETARLWDAKTGRELRTFAGHGNWSNSAIFSPDASLVLTASIDKTARLWDAKTGRELRTFAGHGSGVNSAIFSPDASLVLTASIDKTARLWDAKTGRELRTFAGHGDWSNSAIFSPDASLVLTASDDKTAKLWDAKTGRELRTLSGHGSGINSAIFSPDASLVLTASADKTARLWDAKTGRELRTLSGHGSGINSAIFSPDASLVLTASDDETARLWDAKTGRELRTFAGHGSGINSAIFSPDASLVLTASDDETARLWDAKTGRELRTFAGHGSGINSAIFSPDASLVLTASDDETARLWDAKTGREIRTFAGHGEWVMSAVFSPDASLVLTASADKTARIWHASDGTLLRILVPVSGGWLTLDAEGRYLGEGEGLECLSYRDPEEQGLLPTRWHAEDLPWMRAKSEKNAVGT